MGLIGALFGWGSGMGGAAPPSPSTQSPDPDKGGAVAESNAVAGGGSSTSGSQGGGSSSSNGEGARASSTGGSPNISASGTVAAPPARSAPQGTPEDVGATSIEFGSGDVDISENQMRAYAIAAQARERLFELVDGTANSTPAAGGPELKLQDSRPEMAEGQAYKAKLRNTNGQATSAGILDRAA